MYTDVHHVAQIGKFHTVKENLQSLVFLNWIK